MRKDRKEEIVMLYEGGREDRRIGIGRDRCPHSYADAGHWLQGWDEMDDELNQANERSIDSSLEKALAPHLSEGAIAELIWYIKKKCSES
jgi:hypothetical protein